MRVLQAIERPSKSMTRADFFFDCGNFGFDLQYGAEQLRGIGRSLEKVHN